MRAIFAASASIFNRNVPWDLIGAQDPASCRPARPDHAARILNGL